MFFVSIHHLKSHHRVEILKLFFSPERYLVKTVNSKWFEQLLQQHVSIVSTIWSHGVPALLKRIISRLVFEISNLSEPKIYFHLLISPRAIGGFTRLLSCLMWFVEITLFFWFLICCHRKLKGKTWNKSRILLIDQD